MSVIRERLKERKNRINKIKDTPNIVKKIPPISMLTIFPKINMQGIAKMIKEKNPSKRSTITEEVISLRFFKSRFKLDILMISPPIVEGKNEPRKVPM